MSVRRPVAAAVAVWALLALPWLDRAPRWLSDEAWFVQPAWRWLNEGRYGTDLIIGYHGLDVHTWWQPPGFSVVLMPVLATVGLEPVALRAWMVLFGAVAVGACTALAGARLGSRAAWVCGLGLATHPYLIRVGRQIRMEVVVAALVAVAAWAWLGREPGRGRALLGGLALGAAAWVHPHGLLLAVAMGVLARPAGQAARFALVGLNVPLAALLMALVFLPEAAWDQLAENGATFQGVGTRVLEEPSRWSRWAFPEGLQLVRARWLSPLLGLAAVAAGVRSGSWTRRLVGVVVLAMLGLAVMPNKTWMYGVLLLPLLAPMAAAGWLVCERRAPRIAQGSLALWLMLNLASVGVFLARHRGSDPRGLAAAAQEHLRVDDQVLGTGAFWLWRPQTRLWDVWSFAGHPPGPLHRLDEVDAVWMRVWEEQVLTDELASWIDAETQEVARWSDPVAGEVVLRRRTVVDDEPKR